MHTLFVGKPTLKAMTSERLVRRIDFTRDQLYLEILPSVLYRKAFSKY